MTKFTLRHITDLHQLSDANVAQFANELPGIVATLRLAARETKGHGIALSDVFPTIVFDTELKDEVVVSENGKERVRVSTNQMIEADVQDAQSAHQARRVIEKASSEFFPHP